MAKSAFRQSLELVAQLGFEKGYKIAISTLEKAAEKSPENKQAFLMSVETLKRVQDCYMEKLWKRIIERKG